MPSITNIHEQLLRDEGDREFPYVDTAGKITIGIGHNLTDNGMSRAMRDLLYQEDFMRAENAVKLVLPWADAIGDARRGVLLNMAFNMGMPKLAGFTNFLTACIHQDWETAAAEMHHSLWAAEVGERAARLEEQMRTGEWV